MKPGWTEVALGEVLEQDKNYVGVLESRTYKKLSVKLYGKGVALDASVHGDEVKMQKHQFARTGQIIVSEIWAKKGALGIVPPAGDAALVTSHFFLFDVASPRLSPAWMKWMLKGNYLEGQLSAGAFGTTGYASVRPSKFLEAKIPLPPLAEQQRIAARLDAIETRLSRVRQLREEQTQKLQAALRSAFHRIESESEWLPMRVAAPIVRREIAIEPEGSYPELGIRSFGRGTFHKPDISGLGTTKRLFEIHAGDLVFNIVFAWEGAVAIAQPADHGRFGSHRFISCVCDPARLSAEILAFYFQTPDGLEKLGRASPGGAGRNRTLGVAKLEEILVPVPPLPAQREFAKLLALQARTIACAAESETATAALLPSLLDQIFSAPV